METSVNLFETNFISKEVLPHIKYDKLETEGLTIAGINVTQRKEHELVKIYIDKEECPTKTIKCSSYSIRVSFYPSCIASSTTRCKRH